MDSAEFELEETAQINEESSDFGSLGALAPAWREDDPVSEEEALRRSTIGSPSATSTCGRIRMRH